MTSLSRRTFFANNFWYKWARDVGLVPQCSSGQGASTDMQHTYLYVCMYVLTIKTLSIKKAITSVESKLIGETC